MLYCENIFCIYQEKSKCMLDSISVDDCGLCRDCIWVTIPGQDLGKYKERTRKSFEEKDNLIHRPRLNKKASP